MQKSLGASEPCLANALTTGPLELLQKEFLQQQKRIEDWLQNEWQKSPAPVYGSVDLRNAGFKLAPIDMNLFPAGFNNLNPDFLSLSVDAAKLTIHKNFPEAKKVLIIPEDHTRNIFYWENIKTLLTILEKAGFEIRLGSLQEAKEIPLNDTKLKIDLVTRSDSKIAVNGFLPDVVLLNNDLSAGIPDVLQQVKQPLLPPAELGWSQRLKSEHFQYYANVSDEFSKLISIDPWFIAPLFRHCGEIDFMLREGEDCLIEHITQLFADIQKKYDEYGITCKPYIVVKADAGTYGMAVMIVRNVDEVRNLNRKQRTAMAKSKGGQPVRRVIIQEGVYTFETWGPDHAVAEPVVYLWGEKVVGGFYRVHKERGVDENLNAPGMQFEPLAFAKKCEGDTPQLYLYGVIARLSMLAAAREMLEHKNHD